MKSLIHHFLEDSSKLLTSRFVLIWYRKQNNHVNHKTNRNYHKKNKKIKWSQNPFCLRQVPSQWSTTTLCLGMHPLHFFQIHGCENFFTRHKECDFPPRPLFIGSKSWVLHRISSLIFLIAFLLSILSPEVHGNEGSHRLQHVVRELTIIYEFS